MRAISDRAKLLYILLLIMFIVVIGFFWLDHIGFINLKKMFGVKKDAVSVLDAKGDEPSLVEREEFEKEKLKVGERVEDLDKREAAIQEAEKTLHTDREKLEEIRKGLELEKNKIEKEKKQYSGYKRNVVDLAQKIENIPPEQAVEILIRWEDTLVIDVLRQIDFNATEAGKMSISSYLISLMPKDKASRIMYLMTQL
ncbi:MAG TPA: hypothetical protein PKJ16_07530 [Spirochaetota bacterium]|nr:hypothetical protein [Spirochaetota bacterium]HPU88494.1 hypothetical protein [Spirochaetota bacterium]